MGTIPITYAVPVSLSGSDPRYYVITLGNVGEPRAVVDIHKGFNEDDHVQYFDVGQAINFAKQKLAEGVAIEKIIAVNRYGHTDIWSPKEGLIKRRRPVGEPDLRGVEDLSVVSENLEEWGTW